MCRDTWVGSERVTRPHGGLDRYMGQGFCFLWPVILLGLALVCISTSQGPPMGAWTSLAKMGSRRGFWVGWYHLL